MWVEVGHAGVRRQSRLLGVHHPSVGPNLAGNPGARCPRMHLAYEPVQDVIESGLVVEPESALLTEVPRVPVANSPTPVS